jgi:hypothetical protein
MKTVTLYVCSKQYPLPELRTVANAIPVNCEIIPTVTQINFELESGFRIKLFDATDAQIKLAWNNLQHILAVKCAFVEAQPAYTGCIKNWPGVFRNSLCIASNI